MGNKFCGNIPTAGLFTNENIELSGQKKSWDWNPKCTEHVIGTKNIA